MPKILTKQDIEDNKNKLYNSILNILETKAFLAITVDDIVNNCNMAKGSFYKYFSSKEECLYNFVIRAEKELFDKVKIVLKCKDSKKHKVVAALRSFYLSDQSIVLKVSPDDLEFILNKLSDKYKEAHKNKSENYFNQTLDLLGISYEKIDINVLSLLMDSLHHLAVYRRNSIGYSEASMEIIKTITNYLLRSTANE